jgi:hypothetical protein
MKKDPKARVKKASKARIKNSIGPVEAYNILLQRQINEDQRIIGFSTIFLTANSFLFVGYAILSSSSPVHPIATVLGLDPDPPFMWLRILLSLAGILLALWLFHLNLSAANALRFWHRAQQRIEETAPEFAYMRENGVTPHSDGYQAIRGDMEWERNKFGKWVFEPTKGTNRFFSKLLQLRGLRPILQYYLPATLCGLWLAALITVIVS